MRWLVRRRIAACVKNQDLRGLVEIASHKRIDPTYDDLRSEAIRAIGGMAVPGAAEALVDLHYSLGATGFDPKAAIATAIGKQPSEAGIDLLIKYLGPEPWHPRDEAAAALTRIGSPALPALVSALSSAQVAGGGFGNWGFKICGVLSSITGIEYGVAVEMGRAGWRSWLEERAG